MSRFLIFYQWGILAYFVALHGQQLYFILRAFFSMRTYLQAADTDDLDSLFETTYVRPITLLCPVYNESVGAVSSISSLLALRYPEFQVIVINDGSTDDTLPKLIEAFRLKPSHRVVRMTLEHQPIRGVYESLHQPNLVVVDKENGGKADALNCGINLARYPLVCCMDGDSIVENDALLRVVRPFMDQPNVVASGGVIRPVNGCMVTRNGIRGIYLPKKWLARFQVLEYLRSFLYGRVGLASQDMMFVLSGAFAVFRKDVLLQSGGFLTDTVGEDFEMVVRLYRTLREQKAPHHIAMVPDPICWTEVPEDFKTLGRQRNRWHRGLLDTLWIHKRMLFNPKYGRIGLLSMPNFLFFEALAPLIETSGYGIFIYLAWTHALDPIFAVLFLWAALLLGLINSMVAIVLEVQANHRYQGLPTFGRLLLTALFENLGYRQLTVWWRLRGTFDWLRGQRGWGKMQRQGRLSSAPPVKKA